MPQNAEESSVSMGAGYMGWDARSLQRHKPAGYELVKKSDTFREMNQDMTQILCKTKNIK